MPFQSEADLFLQPLAVLKNFLVSAGSIRPNLDFILQLDIPQPSPALNDCHVMGHREDGLLCCTGPGLCGEGGGAEDTLQDHQAIHQTLPFSVTQFVRVILFLFCFPVYMLTQWRSVLQYCFMLVLCPGGQVDSLPSVLFVTEY